MIDENIPVIIRFAFDDQQSVCHAKIVREGDRYFAEPTLIVPSAAGRFPKLELREENLEFVANPGAGRGTYNYRGILKLDD
jgi:hypothetical protein